VRFNIIGTSGSGKSTLAKKVSQAFGCRYVEMDKIFWRKNWTYLEDPEFFEQLRNELKGDCWVLDGNYTRTIPIKWEKPLIVIWLDLSFLATFKQAVLRALKRAYSKEELWEGTDNRESFLKSFFTSDSIIWWTIKTYSNNRRKNREHFENPDYSHIKFYRVSSHDESDQLISRLLKEEQRN
jgi:adenylate kinase family enzyme